MKLRWRIRGLLVLITLAAFLFAVMRFHLKPAFDEKAAIERLEKNWSVLADFERSTENVFFGVFTWPDFLNPKRCTKLVLPSSKVGKEVLTTLTDLQYLDRLRDLSVNLLPGVRLDSIRKLPSLIRIELAGEADPQQLLPLSGCQSIKECNFDALKCTQGFFDGPTNLPNLKTAYLGEYLFDVGFFDRLDRSGVTIEHLGIVGTFQENNFFKWGRTYAALDKVKTGMGPTINFGSERLTWEIEAVSTDKYIPSPATGRWNFLATPFETNTDWKNLSNYSAIVVDPSNDPYGYVYDGIFQRIESSDVCIKSVNGYEFHVVLKCTLEFETEFVMDAVLPMTGVIVNVPRELKNAKRIAATELKKHFNYGDFEEPNELRTSKWKKRRFVFKIRN